MFYVLYYTELIDWDGRHRNQNVIHKYDTIILDKSKMVIYSMTYVCSWCLCARDVCVFVYVLVLL